MKGGPFADPYVARTPEETARRAAEHFASYEAAERLSLDTFDELRRLRGLARAEGWVRAEKSDAVLWLAWRGPCRERVEVVHCLDCAERDHLRTALDAAGVDVGVAFDTVDGALLRAAIGLLCRSFSATLADPGLATEIREFVRTHSDHPLVFTAFAGSAP